MPAEIVLVHDNAAFCAQVCRALTDAGHEVAAFPDPLVALDALESASRVELLITRVQFPAGRSNGASLALVARHKRPNVRVLFVCRPEFVKDVADLGEVLADQVSIPKLVEAATRLLRAIANDPKSQRDRVALA
jgi:DNA-binding response OmpR family regulator